VHQVRAELPDPEEREIRRVLRRLGGRPQVSGRHGRVRRERQISASATERQHAVPRGIRGGRLPEEPGTVRATGRPAARGQLHQDTRLAHADEEERAERAVGHEAVWRDESGEAEATDSMMSTGTTTRRTTRGPYLNPVFVRARIRESRPIFALVHRSHSKRAPRCGKTVRFSA